MTHHTTPPSPEEGELTDGELTAVLATWMGWQLGVTIENAYGEKVRAWIDPQGNHKSYLDVPDYHDDLDAMHEVEALLFAKAWAGDYVQYLYQACLGPIPERDEWDVRMAFYLINANARERALAAYRTIKGREETNP